jgi:glycosyltransferase involved in cell wall biosynthesis
VPKVTLAMIVKDEGDIIERLLESVYEHVDSALIVDTGSTDDTIEKLRAFSKSRDFPIITEARPWVDFAHNRTEAIELATRQCGSEGYLLLLDADHIFHGDLSGLDGSAPAYMIALKGGLEYRMPYLVQADVPWRYESRTHEYLTTDAVTSEWKNIDSCWLEHRGDGGTRPEKFERDLKFLEEDQRENPDNPRYAFYLAETYKNLGRNKDARRMYYHRTTLGGWSEELYCAWREIGKLSGDTDALLEAWDLIPTRAEAPYYLLEKFNRAGNRTAAYAIALLSRKQLRFGGHILFVEKWIEEYAYEFEYAIAIWWRGNKLEANAIFERILQMESVPENFKEACRNNLALTET